MAIKVETIKAGDTLYDCHRTRMGNTMMTKMGTWIVKVLEMTAGGAYVSWNGNRREYYPNHRLARLRRSPYKPKASAALKERG